MRIERVPHPFVVLSKDTYYKVGNTHTRMPVRSKAHMRVVQSVLPTEKEVVTALEADLAAYRLSLVAFPNGYFWVWGEQGNFWCGFLFTSVPRLQYDTPHFKFGHPAMHAEFRHFSKFVVKLNSWDRIEALPRPELLPPARLLTELLSFGDV